MSTVAPQTPLSAEIRDLLARVRAHVRRYVWLEGLALAFLWLGLTFWLSLAFDWCFEPPAIVRMIILGGVLSGFFYILYRYVFSRAFVPLSDTSMALAVERRYRHFGDSLLTTVELNERPHHATQFNAEMLTQTQQLADVGTQQARAGAVFRWGPLGKRILGAGAIIGSIIGFAYFVPEAFGVWFDRSVNMSDKLWPRHTHLEIDGFKDGVVKVGKGGEFQVIAKAETPWQDLERVVPDAAQVRYYTDDGNRGRENMTREGDANPLRDHFQLFKYSFQNIVSPIHFTVVGGDARTSEYRIDVVENPTINEMTLNCEYPDYFHKVAKKDVKVSGVMQLPQGSKITLHARCNKDLLNVTVDRLEGQKLVPQPPLEMTGATDRRAFNYILDKFAEDQTLLFTLHDTDGIHNREPYRLTLTAKPDEPPQIGARLKGIGTAITTDARLPIQGEIADDVGLARIWYEYQINDAKEVEKNFQRDLKDLEGNDYEKLMFKTERRESLVGVEAIEPPQPELPAFKDFVRQHTKPDETPNLVQLWKRFRPPEEALDVRDLSLKVGQKFSLVVKALDYCNLHEKPNVGVGERFILDVVKPEQLRSILESREVKLRRQFETIIGDMTDTHDSLLRIDYKKGPVSNTPDKKGAEPEDVLAPKKGTPGAEPGDTEAKPVAAENIRLLRVQRAIANGQRSAHETHGVGLDFDDIREELVNNRMDNEEIRTRLGDKIIGPLEKIASQTLPELEKRLRELEKKSNDAETGPVALERTKAQAGQVLREMDEVLKNMIELEDYNQLVENLRQIVELQSRINDQTIQRQRDKAKKLLEDK